MQSGIVTSDLLLTVSQGYAAEITGHPQDARVDMLLAQRVSKLRGIVNGIDITEWDPATDKHLAARYNDATAMLCPQMSHMALPTYWV